MSLFLTPPQQLHNHSRHGHPTPSGLPHKGACVTPLYARHKRTTLAIATAVAAGALLTTGLTTGMPPPRPRRTRRQGQPPRAPRSSCPRPRAPRSSRTRRRPRPATAQEIGLGAKEKLVVKDVVKDADGTVHTRYERTYDGPARPRRRPGRPPAAGRRPRASPRRPRPPSRSPTTDAAGHRRRPRAGADRRQGRRAGQDRGRRRRAR